MDNANVSLVPSPALAAFRVTQQGGRGTHTKKNKIKTIP